jgi:nitrite reductase (NO-forming)
MEHETEATAPTGLPGAMGAVAIALSMLAVAVAILAVLVSSGGEDSAGASPSPDVPAAEFDISLVDIAVSPSSIDLEPGQVAILHVSNDGAMPHDLKVDGTTGTDILDPGETQTIEIGPFTADVETWCTLPGHRDAGMVLAVHVAGAAEDAGHGGSGSTDEGAGGEETGAVIDPQAVPGDDWVARDPVLPPAPIGTVHEISLDATEIPMEVAPGVTQLMWTFGDQVPGPVLRGRVGDTFRVTLTNRGELGHSIDFHASRAPGESLVYEFTAEHTGVFMYHCGTPPTLHHIGNGMYGVIIVEPEDLAPVDQEFVLVQSELYLGPQGEPGDYGAMVADDWDAVVFNGYHNQYRHEPIAVEAEDRYRVWVLDAEPSENSAFHIVGTVFDTVWKEGAYLLRPDGTNGGSQVLDLQPAQGGFVEFSFAEDGLYPFVTHKFSNTTKGALGFFAVGDADTSALGSH